MQKRGSVSIFIIVGLVLLVAVSLIYVIASGIVVPPWGKDSASVRKYTEECMNTITAQGISVMEIQGGYIGLPTRLVATDAYIDMGYKIPYWYHHARDYRPTIRMMEVELSNYVQKNLPLCLDNYSAFKGLRITADGNMTVDASIGEHEVSVRLNYPLIIQEAGSDRLETLERFGKDIPSNIGTMHLLASELNNYENTEGFLENYTDEMIACSDWLPYEGMELTCKPRLWRVQEMKEYTQTMIMHNLHFLMFGNTKYEETGMPYYDKQYKVDFTDRDYRDFKVDVIYKPSWGMDYDVIPSDNGLVRPHEFKISKFLMGCFKVYHHKYSTEYPVVFQITDLTKPGEKFYFATQVMMRRNLPNRHLEVVPWPSEYNAMNNARYCSNTSKVTMFTLDPTGRMLMTPAIRMNRQNSLRIFVRDASTDQYLPGANISYQCALYKCPIGETYYPLVDGLWAGASPKLETTFPDCEGGLVIAEREGYQQGMAQATVSKETTGEQVIVDMYPLRQFNYQFAVIEEHNGLISTRPLAEGENVLLNLKNEDLAYEQDILYPSESDYYKNLTLIVADVTYQLEAMLVAGDQYLGGARLNWTVSAQEAGGARFVTFNLLKLTPALPPSTPEEFQAILTYADEKSPNYPPEFR
jgi:hypothetical protein